MPSSLSLISSIGHSGANRLPWRLLGVTEGYAMGEQTPRPARSTCASGAVPIGDGSVIRDSVVARRRAAWRAAIPLLITVGDLLVG
jgi:hypothetical protein